MACDEGDEAHAGHGVVDVGDAFEALGPANGLERVDDLFERFVDEGDEGDAEHQAIKGGDDMNADEVGGHEAEGDQGNDGDEHTDEPGGHEIARVFGADDRLSCEFIGEISEPFNDGLARAVEEAVDELKDDEGDDQRERESKACEKLVSDPHHNATGCWSSRGWDEGFGLEGWDHGGGKK